MGFGPAPIIEPTVVVVGNGIVTKTKVASFEHQFGGFENPEEGKLSEACWKFDATPAQGWRLVRLEVRCVIRGRSTPDLDHEDLMSDVRKDVRNGYASYWFEDIVGVEHDTTQEYWVIASGTGVHPMFDLTTFYGPRTEAFEINAYFVRAGLIHAGGGNGRLIHDVATGLPMHYN